MSGSWKMAKNELKFLLYLSAVAEPLLSLPFTITHLFIWHVGASGCEAG
jgi:hypothetical protein